MNRFRFYIATLLSIAFASCEEVIDIYESYQCAATFKVSPASTKISADGVNTLRAYIFEDGKLLNIDKSLTIGSDASVVIDLYYGYKTEFYLLGNLTSALIAELESELVIGETTVGDFCSSFIIESHTEDVTYPHPIFMGYEMATELNSNNTVAMDRAFAYIDIDIEEQSDGGVEINSIKFVGVSRYVSPFNSEYIVDASHTLSQTVSYSTPITNSTHSVYYITQGYYNTAVSVVIDAVIDGVETEVIRSLPNDISGKNRYVVRILSNGAGGVTIEPFEEVEDNIDVESNLPTYISVDVNNSTIPDGVTLSGDYSTIYIPFHSDVEMTLQLVCRDGDSSTLTLSNMSNDDFTFTSLGNNKFKLTMCKAYINAMTEHWNISVTANGALVGSIAIERDGYPIRFTGRYLNYLTDDEEFVADTFIDAEMLELTVLSGDYRFELTGDWVRWEPTALESGRYVVQGGWKPNDVDAKGEKQTAELRVLDSDDKTLAVFPMSRLNYSLPVVYIADVWWCKFPMRGNRTKFEDQIQSSDPLADIDIYDYLKTCTGEEFHSIFGALYKGLDLEPIEITKGVLVTEEVIETLDEETGEVLSSTTVTTSTDVWQITEGDSSVTHIGTTDGTSTSPGGYYLPTTTDILTHLFTGTWNVTGGVIPENEDVATLGGYNRNNRRYRFRPFYRTNMYWDDLQYPTGWMEIADVGVTGSSVDGAVVEGPLVWVGAGYAWANGPGYFNTLSHRYALGTVVTPMYINVSGSSFFLSYTSSGGSFIPLTHRAAKIANDFILD